MEVGCVEDRAEANFYKSDAEYREGNETASIVGSVEQSVG